MSRLLWLLAGVLGGVIWRGNIEAMDRPTAAALILSGLVGCGVCWWAAYRGKSQAVATAVAVATATATAEALSVADARAQAVAQQAVMIVLGGDTSQADPRELWSARRAVDAAQVSPQLVNVPTGDHQLDALVERQLVAREADGYL